MLLVNMPNSCCDVVCLITAAAISLASTPVCIPQDTPPARQSRRLMVTPTTFPIISDSARLWTSNQVSKGLLALHLLSVFNPVL